MNKDEEGALFILKMKSMTLLLNLFEINSMLETANPNVIVSKFNSLDTYITNMPFYLQ